MPFFFHFSIHFPFFFFQCIWIIKTLIIIFNYYTVLTTHGCTTTDRVNTLFFIWITIEWDFQNIITSRHIKRLIFIFRDGIFGRRFFTVQFVVNCVWVSSFFFSHKSRRVFFYRYQSLLYFEVKWVEFKHTFLYFFILNLVKFVLFFWRFLYK